MEILLNGQKYTLDQPSSILNLMKSKNIPHESTIAELNGTIISDTNIILRENDVLELIRMVGGG